MYSKKNSSNPLHIITSTINIPYFLESILKNAKKYNEKNFKIFVIGDLKTPQAAEKYCKGLSNKYKVFVKYALMHCCLRLLIQKYVIVIIVAK